MGTKAAFEKWWKDRNDGDSRFETSLHGSYVANDIEDAWTIWTASRAAIEIELDGEACHSDEYFCDGYQIATEAAEEAITSHGIRIKGKTE